MLADLGPLRTIQPERVCIIKPSSLGDVVHTYPTLLALRDRWPKARFTWVINRGLRGLVEGHPDVDDVVVFDRSSVGFGPRGLLNFTRFLVELRQRRFDLAIDAQGLFRSGLMCWATRATYRVGLSEAREGATRFYTHVVPSRVSEGHAVERTLRLAAALGAETEPVRFSVAMSSEDRRWAAEQLGRLPRPWVVLNLGARWLTKRWPVSSFAAIAERANSLVGGGIVVVGAPEDRPLVEELKSKLGETPLLDLCGRTSLPQLAAVAAISDVFVSNDTGPLHLASAAGAKVVGIYLCTNPKRTGPYGARAVAVQSCVWCAPSYVRKCDRLECLTELTPDRVWPAVLKQLRSVGRGVQGAA